MYRCLMKLQGLLETLLPPSPWWWLVSRVRGCVGSPPRIASEAIGENTHDRDLHGA